jgi:hypothetical protein
MSNQSQKHGFIFENDIREKVFNLPKELNNTHIHDIPKHKNIFNTNENCSIKTTGSHTICCGDILRFYNYNFSEKNTIIVVLYEQTYTHKIIKCIYEINYNETCHKKIFGNLTKHEIEQYIVGVKSIPIHIKGIEAKKIFSYLDVKKKIKKKYNSIIQINPKVDRSQSRVQCSIPNFETNLKEFITYQSLPDKPNIIRNKEIVFSIESCQRIRQSRNKSK